jgi:hypothetical protein
MERENDGLRSLCMTSWSLMYQVSRLLGHSSNHFLHKYSSSRVQTASIKFDALCPIGVSSIGEILELREHLKALSIKLPQIQLKIPEMRSDRVNNSGYGNSGGSA